MARRKGELLELLRERQQPAADNRSTPPPRPEPKAAKPESRPARVAVDLGRVFGWARPERLRALPVPWLAVGLVLVLSVPLVWWLGSGFTSDGVQAAEGSPSLALGQGESASAQPLYGVKAITYANTAENKQLAARVVGHLRSNFPGVRVRLLGTQGPRENPRFLEIYVGAAKDRDALQSLLGDVRQLSLPGSSGKREFSSAGIRRYPPTIL